MTDIQNDSGLSLLGERLRDPLNEEAVGLLKQATLLDSFSDIIDEGFADPVNRQFPIFSPQYAAISAMHMQVQDVDPLVKQACDSALDSFGIGLSSDPIMRQEDMAIPEDRFLLSAKRKFPIVDEDTLEKSASALGGVFHSLSLPEKMESAARLYKIATGEYGVAPEDLQEDILRYSGNASCDLHKLASSVSERYAETHFHGYKSVLPKIGALKEQIGGSISFDSDVNAGILKDLYDLDKEAGALDLFDPVYDTYNTVSTPLEPDGIEKVATLGTYAFGDEEFAMSDLLKLSAEDVERFLPDARSLIFDEGVVSTGKLDDLKNSIPRQASREIAQGLKSITK